MYISKLIEDLHAGKRVIVLSWGQTRAHELFREVAEAVPGSTTWRTTGQERIELGEGVISFRSTRTSVRGLWADRVYLDTHLTNEQLSELHPVVASRNGEVVPL